MCYTDFSNNFCIPQPIQIYVLYWPTFQILAMWWGRSCKLLICTGQTFVYDSFYGKSLTFLSQKINESCLYQWTIHVEWLRLNCNRKFLVYVSFQLLASEQNNNCCLAILYYVRAVSMNLPSTTLAGTAALYGKLGECCSTPCSCFLLPCWNSESRAEHSGKLVVRTCSHNSVTVL